MKYKSKTNQEGRVEKERIVKLPKKRISKMWRKRKERRTVVNIVRMYILKIEEKENGTSLEREREKQERERGSCLMKFFIIIHQQISFQ